MKKLIPFIGIFLILLGTLMLILTRINALSSHNSLLLSGLLCIIAGIILHIRSIKHETNY